MFGLNIEDLGRRCGQPPVDDPQRAAVRFVGAGRLVALVGQPSEHVADRHQPRRHRQFLFQRGDFGEVVLQRGVGRPAGGQPNHVGGDVGVAVTVTTDPRTGPQHRFLEEVRVGPAGLQRGPHLRVDLRDDFKERCLVVTQPGLDLVLNLQPRQPDQRGLPQREDVAAQLAVDVAAVLGLALPVQAQPHQFGDAVLCVEHRAAAGLGGVGGDHRRHQRPGQRIGHRCRIQVGGVEFEVCGGQAAVLRWFAGRDVHGAAAFAMDVLGDVGQQREVGEGPDDGDGLMDVDAVERAGELGAIDLGAAHPKRLHPSALDEVEHLRAVLLPDRVAKDCPE